MERWNYCPGAKYYKGFKFCFLATPLKVIKKKKKNKTQSNIIWFNINTEIISEYPGSEA